MGKKFNKIQTSNAESAESFASVSRTSGGRRNQKDYNRASSRDSSITYDSQFSHSETNVPIDRGWAWWIVAACFGMHIITAGYVKTISVIFKDLEYKYNASSWAISTITGTAFALLLGMAPMSNSLSQRFSSRQIVFTGAVIAAVGFVGSYLATTTEVLFVTYGVIVGVGYGLTYAPCIVIIAFYFEKRLALATGLGMSGGGIGTVILPLIMRACVTEYGVQGCLLILGGIMLNVCVCAMLLRPLTFYDRYPAASMELTISQMEEITARSKSPGNRFDESKTCDDITLVSDFSDVSQVSLATSKGEAKNKRARKSSCDNKSSVSSFYSRASQKKSLRAILSDPIFIIYMVGVFSAPWTYMGGFIMLAPFANDRGIPESKVMILMTLLGVCDLFSRIFIGWFSDRRIIPNRYLLSGSIFLIGINAIILPVSKSFVALSIASVIHAVLGGFWISMVSVVLVDAVGMDNMPITFGIMTFCQAVAVVCTSQIVGKLRDVTGTWDVSFQLVGAISVLGGIIASLETSIRKCTGRPYPTLPVSNM